MQNSVEKIIFHNIWYIPHPPDILSVGVIRLTIRFAKVHSNMKQYRCSQLHLLLFLSGIVFAALFVRYFDSFATAFFGIRSQTDISDMLSRSFLSAVLSHGKFLLVMYLLSTHQWGGFIIPCLFFMEGFFLGGILSSVSVFVGSGGYVMGLLLVLFRVLLVIPYSFLLGHWAVERSLSFPEQSKNTLGVLVFTLFVIGFSAFLACTLGRFFGGIYYLKFGV